MSKMAASVTAPRRAAPAKRAAPERDAQAGILEAALRIFARDGYDGASLTDIAAMAKVGHPLIHYHFGTKDRLWKAVIDYAFGDTVDTLDSVMRAARDLEPVDALRLVWRVGMRSVAQHPERMAIVFGEARSGSERFDWIAKRYLDPIYKRLDEVIAAAAAKKQIKPIPAEHLTALLVGSGFAFFAIAPVVRRYYKLDPQRPEIVERHIESVIEVVMNGMRC